MARVCGESGKDLQSSPTTVDHSQIADPDRPIQADPHKILWSIPLFQSAYIKIAKSPIKM
jgi:hypothetical protein